MAGVCNPVTKSVCDRKVKDERVRQRRPWWM